MPPTNGKPANGHPARLTKAARAHQRKLVECQLEAKALIAEKRLRRLKESIGLDFDFLGPWREVLTQRQHEWGWLPINSPSSRRHGTYFPFFQTEQHHFWIRDLSRIVYGTSNHGQGLIRGYSSFVVGTGFEFKVTPKRTVNGARVKPCVQRVTHFLDTWAERVLWYERQREWFKRSRVDGDGFLRMFEDDGWLKLRFVWPEQVVQPPGSDFAEYGFGVKADPDDAETVEAYNVASLHNLADNEEVDADDIVHLKVNSWSGVKRGLPDFAFDTKDALDAASRLTKNVGEGSAVRAAIAFMREHEAATESDIEAVNMAFSDYQERAPFTDAMRNVGKLEPGTVVDFPKGMTHSGSPVDPGTEAHMQVCDLLVRAACARWNAPEWLGTSNAQNMGAYTSSLVAESPFVKGVLEEQDYYRTRFLRVVRRALEVGTEHGHLDPTDLAMVDVELVAPNPEVRNKLEEAQRAQIEIPLGVQSRQGYCGEQNRDWDGVEADNKQYDDDHPPEPPPAPPGGGDDGNPPVPPGPARPLSAVESEEFGDLNGLLGASARRLLLEHGFTGTVRDRRGREYHYADGKRVPAGDEAGKAKAVAATGGGFHATAHPLARANAVATGLRHRARKAMAGLRDGRHDHEAARGVIDAAEQHAHDGVRDQIARRFGAMRADIAKKYGEGALLTREWSAVEAHIDRHLAASREKLSEVASIARAAVGTHEHTGVLPRGVGADLDRAYLSAAEPVRDLMDGLGPLVRAFVSAHAKPGTSALRESVEGDADHHGDLAAALVEAMLEAKTDDPDGDHSILSEVFREMLDEGPSELTEAYNEQLHPRDKNGRFISKDSIQQAQTDPAKAKELRARVKPEDAGKLDAAIGGQADVGRTKRGEQRYQAAKRKQDATTRYRKAVGLAQKVGEGKHTTDDLHELAGHVEHLSVPQLQVLRTHVGGGVGKRKADVVASLKDAIHERAGLSSGSVSGSKTPEPADEEQGLKDRINARGERFRELDRKWSSKSSPEERQAIYDERERLQQENKRDIARLNAVQDTKKQPPGSAVASAAPAAPAEVASAPAATPTKPAPAATPTSRRTKSQLVGQGYRGGVTNVPLDQSRQDLIAAAEANKFDRAKLAELFGSEERANDFWKRKAGGAYTPDAVIQAMGWDREVSAPDAGTQPQPGGTAPAGEGGLSFPADERRPTKANRDAAQAAVDAAFGKHREVFQALQEHPASQVYANFSNLGGGDVRTHYSGRIQGFRPTGETAHPTPTNAHLHKAVERARAEMAAKTRRLVAGAIERGVPVPAEVLADYPDLARPAGTADAGRGDSGAGDVAPGAGTQPAPESGQPKADNPAKPAPTTGHPGVDAALAEYHAAPEGSLSRRALDAALGNLDIDPAKPGRVAHDARTVAGSLASGWLEAHRLGGGSPEHTAGLERAMKAHGMKPVGTPGETVPYDGKLHEHPTGVSTGSPVTVERPGWVLPEADGRTYRLVPAKTGSAAPAAKTAAPSGDHIDASERELRAAVETDRTSPLSDEAAAHARAAGVLDAVRARHTPDEIHELAKRVAGRRGRTTEDSLLNLRSKLTTVSRLIASQNV